MRDALELVTPEKSGTPIKQLCVQISFSLIDDLDTVRLRLKRMLRGVESDGTRLLVYYSGMHRELHEEANKPPVILDMLEEVLGDRLVLPSTRFNSVKEYNDNLGWIREYIAERVSCVYALGTSVPTMVADEIYISSNERIRLY